MSDFLTRLVERERSKATEIEPRLPAVYDPSRGNAEADEIRPAAVRPALGEDGSSTDAPQPRRREQTRESEGDVRPGRPPAGESAASRQMFSGSPASGDDERAEEPGLSMKVTRSPEDAHHSLDVPPARHQERGPPSEAQEKPPRSSVQPAFADLAERVAPLPESPPVPTILPRERHVERAVPVGVRRSQNLVIQTERESGPDVRVSIGRVEVRANLVATPPPARKAREKRAPSLSLEEYLRGKIRRNR